MNQGYVYRHFIQPATAGRTVLAHHVAVFTRATEAEWRARIDAGQVRINGVTADPLRVLAAGDRVTFHRPPWEEPDAPLAFDVVYEDADVLVVTKSSGLQVQPGGTFQEHTLWHQVRVSAPDRADASHVHRLGRGTSGLVLFGKTRQARASLCAQFRRREPCKTYLALARGTGLPTSVQARHPIGPIPHGPIVVWCAQAGGKASHTRLRVLARDAAKERSLVAAQPITGRPDQIRIHLAACGAPLVGDRLFAPGGGIAEDVPPGLGGYFLHAAGLRFEHPTHGRAVKLRARPSWA
ncbi:MAG: RluA family pseudouridine synthase [Planctomycetota bacterium]